MAPKDIKRRREGAIDDVRDPFTSSFSLAPTAMSPRRAKKRLRRERGRDSEADLSALEPKETGDGKESLEVAAKEVDNEEQIQKEPEEVQLPSLKEIESIVQEIKTSHPVGSQEHLEAVRKLRRCLSSYENPPYLAILKAGAVPVLIAALQPPKVNPVALETIFEAAWALSNLAVGDAEVVQAVIPAAPVLISYVEGGNGLEIAEQCSWALGNMSAEDVEYRSKLIANGAVGPLVKLFIQGVEWALSSSEFTDKQNVDVDQVSASEVLPISAATTAAWALTNMFRGCEQEEMSQLFDNKDLPKILVKAIELPCIDLSQEAAWLISQACNSENIAQLNRLVHLGLMKPLCGKICYAVELIQEQSVTGQKNNSQIQNGEQERVREAIMGKAEGRSLLTPLLRVMGNVISGGGNDALKEITTDYGEEAIKAVAVASEFHHHGIQREAAWVLGNVAGMPDGQGVKLLTQINAVPILLQLLKGEPFHVRKEAAFALCNIAAGGGGCSGDTEALNYIFAGDMDAIKAMISLMRSSNVDAAVLGLQFTEMLLRCLPATAVKLVEDADGIDALEALQFGGDVPPDVQQAAAHLVDKYWGIESTLTD